MAIYNGGLNIVAQDISGKEDKSNKVATWSSTTTDTNYPSEKLVKDALDGKAEKSEIEASVTTNSLTAGAIFAKDGNANIGSDNTKFGNLYVNYINSMATSRYVYVNWDGVMEIGGFIDFHANGNPRDDGDYTCRLDITENNKLRASDGIYGAVFN